MMVTLVSQCEKKALNKTRRVLDAFANRIGDNTWQTVITNDGLNAVKKLLRKTASKNTAVSCHWIRSRSRSELIWVVGNKDKFNAEGIVPVNYTERKILNNPYENNWKYLPLIKALVAVSALFHDWGKSSRLFQEKLGPKSKNKYKGDPIRHEWVTCILLNTLIQNYGTDSDDNWLIGLTKGEIDEKYITSSALPKVAKPLDGLPAAAKLILWLIVSHHRLPLAHDYKEWRGEKAENINILLKRITQKWGYENRIDEEEYQKRLKECFKFPKGLLYESGQWMKEVKKWSNKLLNCLPLLHESVENGSFRSVLYYSRLCLMLGDHYHSSQNADLKWNDVTGLFANTDRVTKDYKQKLDEHLVGVKRAALNISHLLPSFEKEPPVVNDSKIFKKLSPDVFRWQDKAVEKISIWKKEQNKKSPGFFAVNMASTGCGKTFANAKVMRSLSKNGKSLRYILALGLRTLTLQTGDEYRDRIGLGNSELAVLIGSKAVMDLHNQAKADEKEISQEESGTESGESLLEQEIDYDCDIPEKGLATVLKEEKDRKFLYAPVLACTIDHIIAATETKRGGRYILPALRLMSSDLVIDEIDDFTGSDLIAIGRLIHLAGVLGRKVMISSATIPPDIAEGYFNTYKNGWQIFSRSRNTVEEMVGCAWIDEFKTEVCSINVKNNDKDIKKYHIAHKSFVAKRVIKLKQQLVRRKAEIIECQSIMKDCEVNSDETKQNQYFSCIKQNIMTKHYQFNTIDDQTGKAVSFGVVRVANISPCVALTKYLMQAEFQDGTEVRVMSYHSQQVLLLRHEQERHLDAVLKRKEKIGEQPAAFNNPVIRAHLDNSSSKNFIFILIATPVEEVGRDHDFDWAVIEPSSYRSIIQLAGRVRRHREKEVEAFNIALMQYNWKAFKAGAQKDKKYFNRPGYEEKINLNTHNLIKLIDTNTLSSRVDATPRIQKPDKLDYRNSLSDLEHFVIQSDLTNYGQIGPETMQGFLSETWYLTALPQILTPFRKSEPSTNIFLTFDENKECLYFAEKDDDGYPIDREDILRITQTNLNPEEYQNLWFIRNYHDLLEQYSKKRDISKYHLSLQVGELSFIQRDNNEYEYNDQFGLVKRKI